MIDAYDEHCQSQPSTQSEWDSADASQRGQENPEAAWVCTDRDVWHPNPYYKGPRQPHPEDEAAWEHYEEFGLFPWEAEEGIPVINPQLHQGEELNDLDDLPF